MIDDDSDRIRIRMQWAINYVCEERGLSNETLGRKIGIATGTVSSYRRMISEAKASFIVRFCQLFDISPSWLFHGEGEPFPGARQKYPEVCGPSTSPETAPESPTLPRTISAKPAADSGDIHIGDDIELTIQVLSSGTPYATALHLNIRSFADAVVDRGRISHVEQSQADFEQRMQSMMLEMKKEISVLRQENADLKEEIGTIRRENIFLKEKLNNIQGCQTGASGEDTGEQELDKAM